MANESRASLPTNSYSPRVSGWLIGVASVLSVLLMLRHPSVHAPSVAAAIAEMQRTELLNGFVHGGLLAMLALVFTGFLGCIDRLGWQRTSVRAAAVFQGCGVVCMLGAALVNGFVVARIADTYAGLPDATLLRVEPTFVLMHSANQTLAQAGTVALSIAIAAWSLALWREGRGARVLGAFGLLVGAVPVAALLAGALRLDVHGMGLVVLAQSAWNVGVAVWLARSRP